MRSLQPFVPDAIKMKKILLFALFMLVSTSLFAGIREIKPGQEVKLKPDEGLIVLAFDGGAGVESVTLKSWGEDARYTIKDPRAGKNMRLLAASRGKYFWTRLEQKYVRYSMRSDDHLYFTVEAGKVNYPGDLIFRSKWFNQATIHRANRSLALLDWLAKTHPSVASQFEFRYAGKYPDPFPAFYKAEIASASSPPESKTKSIPPAGTLPLPPETLWKKGRLHDIELSPDGKLVAEVINMPEGDKLLNVINMVSGEITYYLKFGSLNELTWVSNDALVLGTAGSMKLVRVKPKPDGKLDFETIFFGMSGSVIDPMLNDPDYFLFYTMITIEGKDTACLYRLSKSDSKSLQKFESYTHRKRINTDLKNDWGWITDAAGNIVVAVIVEDGKSFLHAKSGDEYIRVRELTEAGEASFTPMAVSKDLKTLYALTDENRGQLDLVKMDLATGANTQTVYSVSGVDISNVVFDADRQPIGIQYYSSGEVKSEYFDQPSQQLNMQLAKAFPGKSISVIDRDRAGTFVLLYIDSSNSPGSVYLFDTAKKTVEEISREAPWLNDYKFGSSQVIKINTKDGLKLEAYLTMPQYKQSTNFPLVVMPHGGPIGVRDTRHFDRDVQFLISLGYAVLQVNFRGSEGFGKEFRVAGKGSFGTAIEEDIDLALNAALVHYPLDESRMCIMGMSYGGYSALVSAMQWPDRYRCAISFAGVSDSILLFTASDGVRYEGTRKWMEDYVGNPLTGLEKMVSQQPLYSYRKLKTPLMIIHGTEDVRVDYEHAARLQRMLTIAGNPPVMLTLKNEGHGLSGIKSTAVTWNAIAGFLAQYLPQTQAEKSAAASMMAKGSSK